MKPRWFTNRVIWGLLVFLVAIGIWEFHYKPQYRPFYEEGVKLYQSGEYLRALEQFQRAAAIAPNSSDVMLMVGWCNLKLHHFEEARYYFERTLQIDHRVTEARIGNSFVVLETGRGSLDVDAMATVLAERPKDANMQIVAAGALVEKGDNLKAAQMYQALLDNPNYHRAADSALRNLYGLDDKEVIPAGLPAVNKTSELQVRYRAGNNAIWHKNESGWQQFYIAGVNFLPDTPGFTPGLIPGDPGFFVQWLSHISELGANTVQVYSLLPPGFYRAYQRSGASFGLLQQISFDLPTEGDLFDKSYEPAKAQIRFNIDALHGQGNVPQRRGSGGLYVADVSANVVGIVLGGELNPSVVVTTNLRNPEKKRYVGRFVTASNASATEVWIAQMLDYAAQYETDTYGWQHPIAFANRPAFDPMAHPTESPATQNDAVTIDESKFTSGPSLIAGIFASYSVRPYYPDFFLRESRLLAGADSQGSNPVAAYVRDLRSRITLPLVIGDFGIPSAIGTLHIQKAGWNEGGIGESEQAAFITRMARVIKDSGCAGASLFQLTDEWYRANGIAAELELPRDRAALWLNELSPDARFGVIGFHTSKWRLFAGDGSAWKTERTLYQNPAVAGPEPGKNLRSLQAATDEAFLYLRLNVSCVECRGKSMTKGSETFPAFALALNTLPGRAGTQNLPFGNVRLNTGANFLLYVAPDGGTLLVANNYNPFQIVTAPGSPNKNEFRRKRSFKASLLADGGFEELLLQIAEPVYGRDGVYYGPQRYNASALRRARQIVGKAEVDSIAEWYADAAHNAIVVRIPWAKLLVADPSSMRVIAGVGPAQDFITDTTNGIQVTVFSLQSGSASDPRSWTVAGSFPTLSAGVIQNPEQLSWKPWNTVSPEPYRKLVFSALQKEFTGQARVGSAVTPKAGTSNKTGTR